MQVLNRFDHDFGMAQVQGDVSGVDQAELAAGGLTRPSPYRVAACRRFPRAVVTRTRLLTPPFLKPSVPIEQRTISGTSGIDPAWQISSYS